MKRRSIVGVMSLLLISCQAQTLSRLGSISVGEPFPSEGAPVTEGLRPIGWICQGATIPTHDHVRPPPCVGLEDFIVSYRDETWQYNVEVADGNVVSIKRVYLDAWP